MNKKLALFVLVGVLGGLGFTATAKESHVKVTPGKALILKPGSAGEAQVWLRIDPGFHVQANPASNNQVIATTLSNITVGKGLTTGTPIYPKGDTYRLKGTSNDLSVYKGAIAIQIPVVAEASASAAKVQLKAKLRYQACDDQICFFPETVEVQVPVEIRPRS